MRDLLQKPKSEGFPVDFIFARLRGKRVDLKNGVEHRLRHHDSDSWQRVQKDLSWLFEMMTTGLRTSFAPCFVLFEIRTLHLMLRAIAGQDERLLEKVTADSLLSRELLDKVPGCKNTQALVGVLEAWLDELVPGRSRLLEALERGGNRQVEEVLTDNLLLSCAENSRIGPVVAFVADQIDRRNLLTAARCLRWELEELLLLNGGGAISRQLRTALRRHGRAGLEDAIHHFGGESGVDVALLETFWLRKVGRRIEEAGRDPLSPALVIDWLWRRYQLFRLSGLRRWGGEDIGAWEAVA